MNGKWHIWMVVILAVLAVSFVSCRPKGILSSRKMKDVMIDLHKMDGMIEAAHMEYGYDEAKALYYAQVLEKHGITQAQFDSSIVWYTAHPQLFDKIYPRVMAELKDEETRFLEENGLAFADTDELVSDTIALPAFRKADLDSVLWVTRHGLPTSWQPLVHDLEDEFFPQVGVLR